MSTSLRTIWTNPIHFVACAFGFGALPWMPGTWATLAAIPLVIALKHFPEAVYISISVALVLLGVYLCDVFNRDMGTEDHPACAWDEMSSFLLVMIFLPPNWYYLLIGFVLFRFFDILKPWPIGWVDRKVHGGFGVMLDDVIAALFSLIILHAIAWLITGNFAASWHQRFV
jgi:phosphatidylglycerophosphatase A